MTHKNAKWKTHKLKGFSPQDSQITNLLSLLERTFVVADKLAESVGRQFVDARERDEVIYAFAKLKTLTYEAGSINSENLSDRLTAYQYRLETGKTNANLEIPSMMPVGNSLLIDELPIDEL